MRAGKTIISNRNSVLLPQRVTIQLFNQHSSNSPTTYHFKAFYPLFLISTELGNRKLLVDAYLAMVFRTTEIKFTFVNCAPKTDLPILTPKSVLIRNSLSVHYYSFIVFLMLADRGTNSELWLTTIDVARKKFKDGKNIINRHECCWKEFLRESKIYSTSGFLSHNFSL